MPGLLNSLESNEIWSKNCDEITVDRLQKFWSELPLQARQELLKIDKQALFEQARKNYYCSRCNGLLLESFSQFAMHAKSLHQEGAGFHRPNRIGSASNANFGSELDDIQDPSVHPWGGLTATRDGMLTLLDCFINARSLKALQKVFDSARTRGRDRELLYPDACGGGDRGWNRGHGTRELCGLHTARVSFDTLVDFWSALGEETRTSLLRMKEEDFIERLTYRFDSKRFCQDCRRNVIREFKELKELKRLRRELQCTSWFCVADTAFQCEVTEDTVLADWHQFFGDTIATYHHFEWAIGTGEGKSDILEFENVGMNEKVQLNGLRLGGLTACFITLRAWKLDGRCTELCVKAHALKGKPCVHQQLVIADGFVTISKGESIRRLLEHAEEVEEEEDDDVMDKDGNEIDGNGYRPQNHANSPELAREFLLDAATVIFKEQVEKAFREGTTRQSAHSGFVSLALKLLEERVHVACKDTVTLEKQIKLLEEEEKEKREEEERRERRRTKEREKKLRRKERLKGKVREKEREHKESDSLDVALPTSSNGSCTSSIHNDSSPITVDSGGSVSDPGEIKDEHSSGGCIDTKNLKTDSLPHQCHIDENFSARENNSSFTLEESKSSRRKMKLNKWHGGDVHHDETDIMPTHFSRLFNGIHRPLRERFIRTNSRSCNPKFSDKYNHSSNRMLDRYDFQSCKYGHGCPIPENCVLPKGYISSNTFSRDFIHTKQVLEPMDARRKGIKSNTSSAVVSNQSEGIEFDKACNLSESDVSTTYDRSATNCDCCSKDDAMSPMSNGSSDNSSSCISEGGSSSQNVVSSSTSDSEDATPHSQGSDDDTTNGSGSFNPTMDEMRKSVQISDNMSFGFDTSLYHQHHILPTHYHTVHIPVLPSPSVGVYQSQSAVSWQASPNGIMSFPDPHHFIFTRNPLGYNLQETPRSLDYGMKYNPIQTITLPLLNAEHHFPCQNNNREYIAKPKERIDNLSVADVAERQFSIRQIPCSCRSPSNRKNGRVQCNSRIHDDDNSSFSLFHFGGPVVGAAGFNVNSVSSIREESIGRAKPYTTGSKEETAMEEYSLFSACDGVRFSIF